MSTSHILPDLTDTVRALERRYGVGGLRRGVLAMLAGWIGYFLVINMFARALNKVAVPVLDLPLGVVLAMQGTIVIFVIALVLVRRRATAAAAPVGRDRSWQPRLDRRQIHAG